MEYYFYDPPIKMLTDNVCVSTHHRKQQTMQKESNFAFHIHLISRDSFPYL